MRGRDHARNATCHALTSGKSTRSVLSIGSGSNASQRATVYVLHILFRTSTPGHENCHARYVRAGARHLRSLTKPTRICAPNTLQNTGLYRSGFWDFRWRASARMPAKLALRKVFINVMAQARVELPFAASKKPATGRRKKVCRRCSSSPANSVQQYDDA